MVIIFWKLSWIQQQYINYLHWGIWHNFHLPWFSRFCIHNLGLLVLIILLYFILKQFQGREYVKNKNTKSIRKRIEGAKRLADDARRASKSAINAHDIVAVGQRALKNERKKL